MTSVPKPLKFLRPHYDTLKQVYEKIKDDRTKVCWCPISHVLRIVYNCFKRQMYSLPLVKHFLSLANASDNNVFLWAHISCCCPCLLHAYTPKKPIIGTSVPAWWAWLVVERVDWLVNVSFNDTFSTNRLYCAMSAREAFLQMLGEFSVHCRKT